MNRFPKRTRVPKNPFSKRRTRQEMEEPIESVYTVRQLINGFIKESLGCERLVLFHMTSELCWFDYETTIKRYFVGEQMNDGLPLLPKG